MRLRDKDRMAIKQAALEVFGDGVVLRLQRTGASHPTDRADRLQPRRSPMRPSEDQLGYVDEGVERAERLLGRLRNSLPRVEALTPVTADQIAVLTEMERTFLDAYLKDFQDAYEIGKSLFRSGLLLVGFGWPKSSYLDLVNEVKLYGVLPSAAAWLDVRDARNSAAHEYAMRAEQQAALPNEAVRQGRVLLEQLDSALRFVVDRRSQVTRSQ